MDKQPGTIAARHGKICQGDQILEVNGISTREYNQKDIAALLNSLDNEIVLLLGRIPSLIACISEWTRKRQLHWRTRTSTWSSYGNKEKIQNQRSSLPAAKDQPYISARSPEEPNKVFINSITSISNSPTISSIYDKEEVFSRSSSIRSRTRLSIVVEDNLRTQESLDQEDINIKTIKVEQTKDRLLPSIQVTQF